MPDNHSSPPGNGSTANAHHDAKLRELTLREQAVFHSLLLYLKGIKQARPDLEFTLPEALRPADLVTFLHTTNLPLSEIAAKNLEALEKLIEARSELEQEDHAKPPTEHREKKEHRYEHALPPASESKSPTEPNTTPFPTTTPFPAGASPESLMIVFQPDGWTRSVQVNPQTFQYSLDHTFDEEKLLLVLPAANITLRVPENVLKDPDYQTLRDRTLLQWEQETGLSRLSPEGRVYTQEDAAAAPGELSRDTWRAYRLMKPEIAHAGFIASLQQVHKNPQDDPLYQQLLKAAAQAGTAAISQAKADGNLAGITPDLFGIETKARLPYLVFFASYFPEKATAYAASDPALRKVLEELKRQRAQLSETTTGHIPAGLRTLSSDPAVASPESLAQFRSDVLRHEEARARTVSERLAHEAAEQQRQAELTKPQSFRDIGARRTIPSYTPAPATNNPLRGGDENNSSRRENGRDLGRPNPQARRNRERHVTPPLPTSFQVVSFARTALLANPWIIGGILLLIILLLFLFLFGSGEGDNGPGGLQPVSITKSVDKTEVKNPSEQKEDITYTITVSYPGQADDIIVEDPIPEGAEYIRSEPEGKTLDASDKETTDTKAIKKVTWSLSDIQRGGRPSPAESAAPSPSHAAPSGQACKLGSPDNDKWARINQYDTYFLQASDEFGVPADLLKAMGYLESGGLGMTNPDGSVIIRGCDGTDCAPAIGMMQVKPAYHYDQIGMSEKDATEYVKTPEGNVRMAAAILADGYKQYGSWETSILKTYFTSNDVNGTTQQGYLDTVRTLRAELGSGDCTDGGSGSNGGGNKFNNQTLTLIVRAKDGTENTYLVNQATASVIGGPSPNQSSGTGPGNPPDLSQTDFVKLMSGQGRNTKILGDENSFVQAVLKNGANRFPPGDYSGYIRSIYKKALANNINPLIVVTIWGVESSFEPGGTEFGCKPFGSGFGAQLTCSVGTLDQWMTDFEQKKAAGTSPIIYGNANCTYEDPFIYAYEAYTPVCSMNDSNENSRKNFVIIFKELMGNASH